MIQNSFLRHLLVLACAMLWAGIMISVYRGPKQ